MVRWNVQKRQRILLSLLKNKDQQQQNLIFHYVWTSFGQQKMFLFWSCSWLEKKKLKWVLHYWAVKIQLNFHQRTLLCSTHVSLLWTVDETLLWMFSANRTWNLIRNSSSSSAATAAITAGESHTIGNFLNNKLRKIIVKNPTIHHPHFLQIVYGFWLITFF